MAVDDPFLSLRNWRISLYRGDQSGVDLFPESIDATLPPGWLRDNQYELMRARPDRARFYIFDQPGDTAVRVWLQRSTATRVRGGPVQLIRHSSSATRVGSGS